MKSTKIKLVSKDLGDHMFDIEHAQNLLNYEANKGLTLWQLPVGGEFEFKNGIIQRRNIKSDKNATAEATPSESDTASA